MTVDENERMALANQAADLFAEINGYCLKISEGTLDGSLGGHDPDFQKLKGGLKDYWIKKMRTLAHPHAFCVRHLVKYVANPERLCAWLKDQALNTTKWRSKESTPYEPTISELKSAIKAFTEAESEIQKSQPGDNALESQKINTAKETGNSRGTSDEVVAIRFTESGKYNVLADGTETPAGE